ncbi:MAG: hypothetical protein LBU89_12680 [Fibromonadaceae bacterium]|jgi:hypothetical protein|nr:hypothetical protein [Fibromonadaceae bacterium]
MNADLSVIRERGLEVLRKELGPVGTAYFVRQFSSGSGNYTEERRCLQKNTSIEEIANRIKQRKLVKKSVKNRKLAVLS